MKTTLLTIEQIAEIFQVSTRTVHRWIDGGCPVMRPGGSIRFDLEAVRGWAGQCAENN
jgi:excisionase family DNA binding protein